MAYLDRLLHPGSSAPSPDTRNGAVRCATPTGSAGHAGTTANLKLTFHLDHSAGADRRCMIEKWLHGHRLVSVEKSRPWEGER
jgi:hypothetical protein